MSGDLGTSPVIQAGLSPASIGSIVEVIPADGQRGLTSIARWPGSEDLALRERTTVEIVIPVYNEQEVLSSSVLRLHRYVKENLNLDFQITIVDNASTDSTARIGTTLARHLDRVGFMRLEQKGRGLALRAAWSASGAEILCYMDVDLSTDLSALGELLEPLIIGKADLSIGSRLAKGSEVTRGIKREAISRSYNLLLRVLLSATFTDAQCGFKAVRREVVESLLREVRDECWFFDTELLYLAQRGGLRIHEVPVRWVEDPDSRVDILATVREDLRGVMRLRRAVRANATLFAPSSKLRPAHRMVAGERRESSRST